VYHYSPAVHLGDGGFSSVVAGAEILFLGMTLGTGLQTADESFAVSFWAETGQVESFAAGSGMVMVMAAVLK
jgi:hypothetical protein